MVLTSATAVGVGVGVAEEKLAADRICGGTAAADSCWAID